MGMWRCARCGARNAREVSHCGECGMPNPFADGGRTQTMDLPPVRADDDPQPERSRPWTIVAIVVAVVLLIGLCAVVLLS